jgi:hypothetical protein
MALTSTERSKLRRSEMAANGVKELRNVHVPKDITRPTERELKGRIAFLVKQFLKSKGDI